MQKEKSGKAGPAVFIIVLITTLIFFYWILTKAQ